MKVILLSDVKKVGKKGSIVEVSDGYGANFLIPNKLAVKVTKTSMDIKNKQDDDKAKQDEQNRLDAIALKERMENLTVEINAKVGKDGKMFGAISTKQIVEEYKKQFDIELDKRKIVDTQSLGSFGIHVIEVELFKGVIGEFRVHVKEK